ncbi:glycosyltransferase family 2 protein [Limnospira platensis CENA597]|uniref:glycosyltransferase family 2 protein n=1 Tax=Limnospira platensis TaxID=118562 RepID=UPI003D9FB222
MSESYPRISVVMPAYNCEQYIAEAIDSVLAQTETDYEIIVVDDGSQDQTRSVVATYHSQVRYVYQHNQGVSVARNHGLSLARGEFITFLDADDYFFPDTLRSQLAVFDADPELAIVHSGWRRVNQTGEMLIDVQPWEMVAELNLENWLRWKPLGTMGTLMFRRQALQTVGGFEPGLAHAEDVDLILRLVSSGYRSAWLKRSTVCYRQHDRNTMRDGISQAKSINYVLDKFFNLPDIPLEIKVIEDWVRYSTLVWSSWYLYHTGFNTEMVEYLQRSWSYSPFLPMETVINWVESFTQYSQNVDAIFDVDHLSTSPEWQGLLKWVISSLQYP